MINPAYKFRNDIKRVVLTNNNSLHINIYDQVRKDFSSSFSTIMHPLVAYLFSFFDGSMTLNDTFKKISSITGKSEEAVKNSFISFINNSESLVYPMSDKFNAPIPINFIIQKGEHKSRELLKNIDIEEILKDVDLERQRYYVPNEITLMVNNKCYTDCVYCYANTSKKITNPIPFERVKELIKEAHNLGCREFGIGGGEFFLYEHWFELLQVLFEHEYEPYISTKIPINEDTIKKLKQLHINKIQISLDSVNPQILKETLNAPLSYFDKMKQTLDLLQKHNITLYIKSVVTKYNDSVEEIKKLTEFLLSYNNLYSLSIAPGEKGYNKPFTYNSSKEKLLEIQKYITGLENLKVTIQSYMHPAENISFENKMQKHITRAKCSGNLAYFYILPDGKVTVCEQTYWHPFLILGDLNEQSIIDVWNSKKALSLWNIQQSEIQETSPCKTCTTFENCRRGPGVCWKMAIQAYGADKYDYPDPMCPYAPPVTQPFYIDKTVDQEFIDKYLKY